MFAEMWLTITTDVSFALSPEGEVPSSLFSEIPWKLHIFFILERRFYHG